MSIKARGAVHQHTGPMHHAVRRHANRLALWAVLALALLPTTGRLWAALQAPAHAAHRLAPPLHDAEVDARIDVDGDVVAGNATGHPPAHGEDCDYCVLAAGLALAGLQGGANLHPPQGDARAWAQGSAPRPSARRAGLGARGPPRAA